MAIQSKTILLILVVFPFSLSFYLVKFVFFVTTRIFANKAIQKSLYKWCYQPVNVCKCRARLSGEATESLEGRGVTARIVSRATKPMGNCWEGVAPTPNTLIHQLVLSY